ncbi:MAG: hypothetical protein E7551_08420 [Ruminococcaceae bacterium]|nr:hypothetical protein [Oscillospiraceae bacterium]
MKIAVQTGGITGHFDFNLAKVLMIIKRSGFNAIDWNIPTGIDLKKILEGNYEDNIFHKDIESIKAHFSQSLDFIKRSGLTITQMHAPFPAYVPGEAQLLDYMIEVYKKLIIFSDFANCKNLIVHGICTRSDHPEDTKEYIENLNLKLFESLIPTLVKTNVTVCLENLFTWRPSVPYEGPGHCSDADEAIEIIDHLNKKAGKECFGLCFDTGHANLVGFDSKKYILKLGNRIKSLHIHDNDGITDLHLAPYSGNYDWTSFCDTLKEINYEGDLSFETFGQVAKDRIPTELLESSLKSIAECGEMFKTRIENMNLSFDFLENELWWGGEVGSWNKMPISAADTFKINFRTFGHNQTAPLFLSNKGRIIFCKSVFIAKFENGVINLSGKDKIELIDAGKNLRDAYDYAAHKLYSFEKRDLPKIHFQAPQYNTWVQMGYMQSEEGVLSYAEGIIKNGYKPGVLMIDEGWQMDYGDWRFNYRFPNPKEMVEKLHTMGFKVMLWVVPYLSVCSPIFRPHWFDKDNHFCRTYDDQPAIDHWWNGYTTSFNMCLEGDRKLFTEQLEALMKDYDIDGFKFDGGNVKGYRPNAVNGKRHEKYPPEALNMAWNDFGAKYEYHEYKDTYNRMGRAVIQRICDAAHAWEGNGINKLIPSGLMQNLLGYPYNCPDMIGGGCVSGINEEENKFVYDSELFVRNAQLAAFFPIMQFSAAPFEVLDEKHAKLVKAAADLHIKLSDKILKLIKHAMETGEPIMQHMEYAYPNCGYEREIEQFMLGSDLLVAPVVNQGETEKRVVLPQGKWKDPNGKIFEGRQTIIYPAPIEVIPYFEKID